MKDLSKFKSSIYQNENNLNKVQEFLQDLRKNIPNT